MSEGCSCVVQDESHLGGVDVLLQAPDDLLQVVRMLLCCAQLLARLAPALLCFRQPVAQADNLHRLQPAPARLLVF